MSKATSFDLDNAGGTGGHPQSVDVRGGVHSRGAGRKLTDIGVDATGLVCSLCTTAIAKGV